ncbi:MAG: 4-methyl-5(B-hydroxyethyl)-thiazole monophosphate biosynthesis protein [Bacillales bacterium]|nr:4-methyl-5(B-hydroxyethyl)-thiazole monophosphate biosynthesis protein [Bacillales bacterium]
MKTCIFLANGFEEIEALTVIDFFRRAGAAIEIVSISEFKETVGSHSITIIADKSIQEFDYDSYGCFVLPGGLPGATNLRDSKLVIDCIQRANSDGKFIGAICAAPIVLVSAGIANGRRITSFPGSVKPSKDYFYLEEDVVVDGKLITSRAVGTAFQFTFKLLEMMGFDHVKIKDAMLIK